MKYIDVILPLPLNAGFTYAVPEEWAANVRVGMRVVVPFGKKKLYTAIVSVVYTLKPETAYEVKEIICVLDEKPVLRFPQLKFWEWISSYYQSAMGDVYQAAVPAGLKLESETQVCINLILKRKACCPKRNKHILDALSEGKPMAVMSWLNSRKFVTYCPFLKGLWTKAL
jgi:primosomal protein N' (replication factor Y)